MVRRLFAGTQPHFILANGELRLQGCTVAKPQQFLDERAEGCRSRSRFFDLVAAVCWKRGASESGASFGAKAALNEAILPAWKESSSDGVFDRT